jgi:arylsulfatase A-like enzyme
MAKAPLPKDLDGKSMVKTWRGEAGPLRSKLLVEYYSDTEFPRLQKLGYQAIRTERYKFIRYRELTGVDELYDLHKDPFELDNLLRGDASAASLRRELSQQLDEMIDSRAPKIDPH